MLGFILGDEPNARVFRALLPAIFLAAWFILGLVPYAVVSTWRGPLRDADMENRGGTALLGIWIRQYFLWVSRPAWFVIVRSNVPANAVTTLSALLGLASGLAFASGHFALGGWLYILSGALDVFDGRLARLHNAATPRGAVFDSVLDRYVDAAALSGLAWFYRDSWVLAFALLALSGSLMVSYVRARGEIAGVDMRVGLMQRPERIVSLGALTAMSPVVAAFQSEGLSPDWMVITGIVFLAVTTQHTAASRFLYLLRRLEQPQRQRPSFGSKDGAFRAAIAAVAATGADFLATVTLVERAGFAPWFATMWGCAVGAVVGFGLGRIWAFSSGTRSLSTQLVRYAVASISGMLLNSGGVYLLQLVEVDYRIAWGVVRACVFMTWSFPLQRDYVFQSVESQTSDRESSLPTRAVERRIWPMRNMWVALERTSSNAVLSAVRTAFHHPGRTLGGVAALVLAAMFANARLSIDSDLAALLPKTARSVVDLEALSEKEQGLGYVTIVLQQGERDARVAYAHALTERLGKLPSIRYVEFERPVAWFEQRALYYLDVPRLKQLADEIEERTQWEIVRHNPLYVDFEESGPPAVQVPSFEGADAPPALQRHFRGRYFEDAESTTQVILARPVKRATDLDFSRRVVGDVDQAISELNAQRPNDGVVAAITGTFAKKVEQQQRLSKDLSLSSIIAFGLVAAFLMLHFRSLIAVFVVCVPLMVGLVWTFGLAAVLFGHLNILTAFMGAILLGLGIDHGIHLLGSFQHYRAQGQSAWQAVEATYEHTGTGVIASALTTAVVFFGVAYSDFRAFREFGLVAGLGTLSIVLAYFVVLPALLSLFPNLTGPRPLLPWLSPSGRTSRTLALVIGVPVLLAILPIGRLTFNANLSSLEDRSLRMSMLDDLANRVLGHSQMPAVIMTQDPTEEAKLLGVLRERQKELGTASTIGSFLGPSDVVPTQQEEKRELMNQIRRSLARIDLSWLKEEKHRETHQRLSSMVEMPPFTRADLPPEVRRRLLPETASPDSGAGFVLAFPNIDLGDGDKVTSFAPELREPAGSLPIASEALILADILTMIRKESPLVLGLACCGVWAVLWVSLGRVSMTLLPMSVGAITALSALGLTAAFGSTLNYLNILMIPVLFGITVDGTIHLVKARLAGLPFDSTLRAIAGCLLTTGFGFGSLIFTEHPGLRSLGALAVTQLALNAVITLFILPAILEQVSPMERTNE